MNFSLPCFEGPSDRRAREGQGVGDGSDDGDEEVRKKIGGRPFLSCASSRSSECLGRIIMRSFLCSPLVVVGKGLKLISNRRVRHGSGTRSKVCAVSRYCLPRREFWNVMKPSHGSLAAG